MGTINKINISNTDYDLSVKEAFLTWGGQNFTGDYGPIDAAMIPNLGANRLAFFSSSYVTLEYSTNNGASWTAVSSPSVAAGLFAKGSSFVIGNSSATKIDKSTYRCRITITTTNASCYTQLNKFAIYLSTSGSSNCWCTIEARTKANQDAGTNSWAMFANQVPVSGWSGWNIINTSTITTHGNQTSHYSQIRFTFGVGSHGSSVTYPGLTVQRIMGFGGVGWSTPSNMATDGHLYSYDASQNATFPASVSAPSFIATSDRRLKENIIPYTSEKSILDLPVYKYNFIKDETKAEHIGCLAQDLQEICPEIVDIKEDGYLGIQESKLVYLLLDEVKKLKQEINDLRK